MTNPFLEKLDLGKDPSGRPLVINRRTKAMLEVVERKIGRKLIIVQGSFMAGKAAKASGPTHDRAGVVDIRTKDQTAPQQAETLLELRKVGFAAFHRTTKQKFSDHIHAVAIGDPDLDPSAAKQVEEYKQGMDGLIGDGLLDGPQVQITVFPLSMTELDLGGDWFDMATKEDLEKVVDERLSFWLPRMLNVLLNGQPNQAFPPDSSIAVDNMGQRGFMHRMANVLRDGQPNAAWPPGSSAAVDNVGLDGVIKAAAKD